MSRAPRTTPGHPLLEMTRARLVEFVRDPSAIFWVFGFPVVLAVVLGIAFRNQGPEVVQIAVVGPGAEALLEQLAAADPEADPRSPVGTPSGVAATTDPAAPADGTPAARPATEPPASDGVTPNGRAADGGDDAALTLVPLDPETAARRLRTGHVLVVLEVPARTADPPALSCRLDPTRPGALAAKLAIEDRIQRAFGRTDPVTVTEERVEEAGGRYIDYLVPGLIGLNVMSSCMWGMGYAIVDTRRRKLLKRFAVTPMNRAHYLLAYILSRLVFLVTEVALLITFGWLVFGVAVHGSVLALGLIAILGMLCFSGLALLIASRTESTETAAGYMNFVQLPMWLLSGSFFAYSRFPEVVHPLIKLLPLTALNDASRAVVNDGMSIFDLGPQLLVLAVWGGLSFVLALRFFRWQ